MGEFGAIHKGDLTDRQLCAFWEQVRAAGKGRSIGYDCPPFGPAGFAQWMRQPDVEAWIVLFRGEPCGLLYLNGILGKTAHGHFTVTSMGTARVGTPIGRLPGLKAFGMYCMGSVLWNRDANGLYTLDTVIGVLPACNDAAVRLVRSTPVGMEVGVVPGAAYFYDERENVPALVTAYTRENVPRWCAAL